ncbi:hypothetical protein AAG906_007826 [Vitis piasezkii]
MSILLPNHSATLWNSLREFSQLRMRVWHTSATSQHRSPHLAAAKRIAWLFISFLEPHRASLRSSSPISSGQISATRNGRQNLRRGITLPPSPVPSPVSSPVSSPIQPPVPSPAPQAEPQEPQPPLPEPQIPTEIALEEVIRRPMLTQPPIEGNLDCRARPFHSELCFDIAAF